MFRDCRVSGLLQFVSDWKIFAWLSFIWLLIVPLIWIRMNQKRYNFSTGELENWFGISSEEYDSDSIVEFDRVSYKESKKAYRLSMIMTYLKAMAVISGKLLFASLYLQSLLVSWAMVRSYPDFSGVAIFPWKYICRIRCPKVRLRRKSSHKSANYSQQDLII